MDHVNILIENFEPFVKVITDDGTVQFTGYMKVLLNNLIKSMNFSYTLLLSTERTFGDKHWNGSWTGMFGMLQREEADMLLVPIAPSQERLTVLDISSCISMSTTNMLVGVPKHFEISFAFLAATDKKVAFGVGLSLLSICLVGKIISVVLKDWDVGVKLWTICVMFFQKGATIVPYSNSGRILLMSWILSTFVLITAISTALTSILSVAGNPDYIKSIDDLPRFSKTKVILPKGSSTTMYVEKSQDPIMKYIWRSYLRGASLILHPNVLNKDLILNQVATGDFVIMKNIDTLKVILRDLSRRRVHMDCANFALSEPIRLLPLTLAFRKGLPSNFTEKVNEIISWTVDTSYLRFLNRCADIEYRRCLTKKYNRKKEHSLGFRVFEAPLMLLGAGCTLSLSVMVLERMISHIEMMCL